MSFMLGVKKAMICNSSVSKSSFNYFLDLPSQKNTVNEKRRVNILDSLYVMNITYKKSTII